jgi:hypothetical protein
MMPTVSLRIDRDLAFQTEREARIQNRSKTKQIAVIKSGSCEVKIDPLPELANSLLHDQRQV